MQNMQADEPNGMQHELIEWLCTTGEPWVRYQTRTQLLGQPETDPEVGLDRQRTVTHPKVRQLIATIARWNSAVLKRHNDASHMLHLLPVLSELGVRSSDAGMDRLLQVVLEQQSADGAFLSRLTVPRAFGGSGEETLAWMLCDAPTTLYALIKLGLKDHPAVQRAKDHLLSLVSDDGWLCESDPGLGKIQGPGRKADPCPYANLIAVKALVAVPELQNHPAVRKGAETLLQHWEHQRERKLRMFGIGTDFRKLKYPFVWYDILHVAESLSQLAWARTDARLLEMVATIASKADAQGRFTAESVWMAWKDWDFGQKRQPSPWLTYLVLRLLKRFERGKETVEQNTAH